MPADESLLDPNDWDAFRAEAHRLLDACIDHLGDVRKHPWQPVGEARVRLGLGEGVAGRGIHALVDELVSDVLPYATGNIHPKFFGWVHGTGLASGLLSEMVAATMNSNCGGRDHGAIYVERDGQKAILIGKGGQMLKKIGTAARLDIERMLGKKVFLETHVKVAGNWRKERNRLRQFGYFE